MEKVVKINGKEYVANFNASKELSKSIPGVKDEVLVNMKRVSTWNGFRPVVHLESGDVTLGFHFYTPEEKQAYKDYDKAHRGNGGGTRSGVSAKNSEVREALLTFQSTLKGNAKKELGGIITKYFPDPKLAAAKAALEGLTDEQKAALKALLG